MCVCVCVCVCVCFTDLALLSFVVGLHHRLMLRLCKPVSYVDCPSQHHLHDCVCVCVCVRGESRPATLLFVNSSVKIIMGKCESASGHKRSPSSKKQWDRLGVRSVNIFMMMH